MELLRTAPQRAQSASEMEWETRNVRRVSCCSSKARKAVAVGKEGGRAGGRIRRAAIWRRGGAASAIALGRIIDACSSSSSRPRRRRTGGLLRHTSSQLTLVLLVQTLSGGLLEPGFPPRALLSPCTRPRSAGRRLFRASADLGRVVLVLSAKSLSGKEVS